MPTLRFIAETSPLLHSCSLDLLGMLHACQASPALLMAVPCVETYLRFVLADTSVAKSKPFKQGVHQLLQLRRHPALQPLSTRFNIGALCLRAVLDGFAANLNPADHELPAMRLDDSCPGFDSLEQVLDKAPEVLDSIYVSLCLSDLEYARKRLALRSSARPQGAGAPASPPSPGIASSSSPSSPLQRPPVRKIEARQQPPQMQLPEAVTRLLAAPDSAKVSGGAWLRPFVWRRQCLFVAVIGFRPQSVSGFGEAQTKEACDLRLGSATCAVVLPSLPLLT